MEIAWTTAALLALFLPGIFFFIGLATYERLSREIIRSSVASEVGAAILVAVLLHTVSIVTLSAFGFRLSQFIAPLAEYDTVSHAEWVDRVSQRLLPLVFYFFATSMLGLALGFAAARGVVAGSLRRFATHKWIYDVIHAGRKGGIVTAFVMTTVSENNRVLMYRGRIHEIYLNKDGKISYIALKNCARYYMIFEGTEPKTTPQLELFSSQGPRPKNIWDYLLIDGANIANILFDSSPEIKKTAEGTEALEAAFTQAILRGLEEDARRRAERQEPKT
jgi:hypothetical protein